MRIWCVSMVLTLTFNSLANSEALTPRPIKEKISSSRALRRDYRTLSPKDREILACNRGPKHAIRHEWISTLAPSADPGRENESASLPLKESNALESKLCRIRWLT